VFDQRTRDIVIKIIPHHPSLLSINNEPCMKRIFIWSFAVVGAIVVFLGIYLAYLYYDGSKISEGAAIAKYAEPKSALLIIDMQEGTSGSLSKHENYISESEAAIRRINELAERADAIGILVVYIRQETSNLLLNLFTGSALAEGTAGTEIDRRIRVVSDHIFPKSKMDAFSNADFDRFLINNQVNFLYITGLDAAYCVKRTSLAALNRGYEVKLVEDAIISESDELKQASIEEIKAAGAKSVDMNKPNVPSSGR
jgi:nicotinamidase-related amidase